MTEYPVKGDITFPFDGTVELPDFPGNGGSAPEEYHWFQDGKDLSIRVGDQKLNAALIQDIAASVILKRISDSKQKS